MRYGAKEMAQALYLAVKGLDDAAAAPLIREFAAGVTRKFGAQRLSKVIAALPEAASAADGIERITVESARPLAPGLAADAVRALGVDPDQSDITSVVRPELIAGIRVRRRDSVFDSTVSRRLERFRQATSAERT